MFIFCDCICDGCVLHSYAVVMFVVVVVVVVVDDASLLYITTCCIRRRVWSLNVTITTPKGAKRPLRATPLPPLTLRRPSIPVVTSY